MSCRIGMNMLLWGTSISEEHLPVFAQLAEAGFDGVEIPVAAQTDAELARMATACDELGLARTASAFVGADGNPVDPEPAVRRRALDNLRRSIDGASLLGASILVGGLYQAHKYFTGRGPTEREWDWSAQYIQAGGEYAASVGLYLGLEVLNRFEVFLINTVSDCRRMVEQVGLQNVGIHYDTHHANIEEPAPLNALQTAAPFLNHVHLSESHRGTLGSGQVDWAGNFAALESIGYDGWLVIEAFGTADPELATGANVWRNAFDSEEALCVQGLQFIRNNLATTNRAKESSP